MHTINVIEMNGDDILQLVAFSDDGIGTKDAESLFSQMVIENDGHISTQRLNACTDAGVFKKDGLSILLVHSV